MKEFNPWKFPFLMVFTIFYIFGFLPAHAEANILPDIGVQESVEFPEESNAFYLAEGESAVSTNFSGEATLNFAASGSRTLQLGRYTSLPGGVPFSAEFLLNLEEGGTYEFWYGGTPPGPRDDFAPSYASPFVLSVDESKSFPVYREDVQVVEQYLPGYYWTRVGEIDFSRGIHTIRFEVSEKRRYDGKYLFYLDSFFLVRKDAKGQITRDLLPDVFPSTISEPYDDITFRSISEYESVLKDNPDPAVAEELAQVYALTGEYTNSLRTLRKAQLIQPDNPDLHILAGKNRIWKGETAKGLEEYRKALNLNPDALDVWIEAGKLAGWTGQYDSSIGFYEGGLRQFPESLELHVHLALTYLWASRNDEAEEWLRKAEEIVRGDAAGIKRLAEILIIAGYPERAVGIYSRALPDYPNDLEFYLLLCEAYTRMEMAEEAAAVIAKIEEVLPPSEELVRHLEVFRTRISMRDNLIEQYERDLAAEPDNLNLRQQLVQTYFWNGLRQKAIGEYLNIITNHSYRYLVGMDAGSIDLLETLDRLYVLTSYFRTTRESVGERRKFLGKILAEYQGARKDAESGEQSEEALERLDLAEQQLADGVEATRMWWETYADMENELKEELRRVPGIVDVEKEEAERFAQVTESVAWKWDRSDFIEEQTARAESGSALASYVVGRVMQVDRRFKESAPLLETARNRLDLLPVEYAWLQHLLWTDSIDPDDPEVITAYGISRKYAAYMGDMEGLLVPRDEAGVISLFTDETAAEAEGLSKELSGLEKASANAIRSGERNILLLHAVLERRLSRAMYSFEEETYLIRFELGNYYLAEGDLPRATEQYRKVLQVDPWNTSALYQLGIVRERYGDWKQAMRYYRRVYEIDPRFENTALYSNRLARRHADTLSFTASTMADTSKLSYHGEGGFHGNLTSWLGLDIKYEADSVTQYKVFGEEQRSSYLVHTLSAGFPVSLLTNRLVISADAGFTLFSRIYDNTFLLEGERLLSLPEFLGDFYAAPLLGAGITASFDPVYATGKYRYGVYEETFNPERDIVDAHDGEASVLVSLGRLDVPVLKTFSFRTYGRTRFLHTVRTGDRNFIGSVSQDITSNIHLADTPWTTLILGGTVVFEHSKKEETVNYYTPLGVLVTKGSVGASTWISLKGGNVLGLYLNTGAGMYAESLGLADEERSLQLEAAGRVDFQKGNSAFYLTVNGSAAFSSFPETRYWSLLGTMGYTASLPRLLAE